MARAVQTPRRRRGAICGGALRRPPQGNRAAGLDVGQAAIDLLNDVEVIPGEPRPFPTDGKRPEGDQ